MYTTKINILKILYQTKIFKKNIAIELEITNATLTKSIQQINTYLRDLKIKTSLLVENEILMLDLTKNEWSKLFISLNELSHDSKIDFLYIKFVYFGFINLEVEKEILNISRSSINRYYSIVKNLLISNGSKISYINGKGNSIIKLSEYNKYLLLIKITKLLLEEDILTTSQKKLLNSIKKFETKTRILEFIKIHKKLNISIFMFWLYFLCSLEICSTNFKHFHKQDDILNSKFLPFNVAESTFSNTSKKELEVCLNDILFNKHYSYFKKYNFLSKKILVSILKKFKIDKNNNIELILFQHIYIGILKKENKILKIRNSYFHNNDILFLKKLESVLNQHNTKLYLHDKHKIVADIRKEFVKINILKIKKILILLNDINTFKEFELKKQLLLNFSNIKFDIVHNICYEKNSNQKYDLCIDDNDLTLAKGDIIDRINQQIEKFIIKNYL